VLGTGGVGGPTISSLVEAIKRGESTAAEPLFAALYSELHRLAKRELARLGVGASLSATTPLHQAYLNMAARNSPIISRPHPLHGA